MGFLYTTPNLCLKLLTVPQIANPSVAALYEDALVYETGSAITSAGAMTAYSGSKTGRSPLDKRIVKEKGSEKDVWWGPVNKPMTPEVSRCSVILSKFISGSTCGKYRNILNSHLPLANVMSSFYFRG